MASVQFTVFEVAAEVAQGQPLQEGVITIGAASVQGAVITADGRRRRRVRVFSEADCFVTWSENPVAIADGSDGRMMAASQTEYFDIEAGHRLAVIERV